MGDFINIKFKINVFCTDKIVCIPRDEWDNASSSERAKYILDMQEKVVKDSVTAEFKILNE